MSESFEQGVDILRQEIDAKVCSYFSSCVNCGLCAEACLFYTETGDPRYTPIYKLEPMKKLWRQERTFWGRLGKALGIAKPLNEKNFAEWEELLYDSCTLCGRCSMVCPLGIDIVYMIRKQREGFSKAGYAPSGLKEALKRALTIGSPMGVTLKTLTATLVHVEQAAGMAVPIDRQGADYMALLSSMEVVNYPEYIESITRIFASAGVSWTISSEAFEATNSGIQIGDKEAAAELVKRVVTAAEKLGVKYVISPECGHAYLAMRWEGPNLIGRALPFQVVHITELLDELMEAGRLQTAGYEETRLTYHDPCQIVRMGGVVDPPRNLIKQVASNFVEMKDHAEMNWCCGGGGGVSANERADALRLKAFAKKKRQLDELNVDTVVTSCANCRLMLEDGIEEYDMDLPIIGLTEMLAEHLVEKT